MSAGAKIDAFFRPAYVPERLAALRILIGAFTTVYLMARLRELANLGSASAHDFAPVGPIKILSAPLPAAVVYAMIALTILSGVGFTIGLRFRIFGPLFAAAFLWTTSYRNSFGMVFHTENLPAIHLVVLALADSAAVWSLDARQREAQIDPAPRFGWPVRLMSIVTCATYVLAGIAKARESGMDWITSDTLANQIAYDNIRKAVLGDSYSILGVYAFQHPWMLKFFAATSMALELGAPIALIGGKVTKIWVVAVYGFHVGIAVMMMIFFPYPMLGFAFLSFLAPEKLVRFLVGLYARLRAKLQARRRPQITST